MARRRKTRRRSKQKLSVAVAAPALAGAMRLGKAAMAKDFDWVVRETTGFNPAANTLNAEYPIRLYGPILIGAVVSRVASRLGVNRHIPKWIPFKI